MGVGGWGWGDGDKEPRKDPDLEPQSLCYEVTGTDPCTTLPPIPSNIMITQVYLGTTQFLIKPKGKDQFKQSKLIFHRSNSGEGERPKIEAYS